MNQFISKPPHPRTLCLGLLTVNALQCPQDPGKLALCRKRWVFAYAVYNEEQYSSAASVQTATHCPQINAALGHESIHKSEYFLFCRASLCRSESHPKSLLPRLSYTETIKWAALKMSLDSSNWIDNCSHESSLIIRCDLMSAKSSVPHSAIRKHHNF